MDNVQQDHQQDIDSWGSLARYTTRRIRTGAGSVWNRVRTAAVQGWSKTRNVTVQSWNKTRTLALEGWEKGCTLAQELTPKAREMADQVRIRVARHPVSPLLYITVLVVGIGAVAFNGMYTRAYVAYVDGQEVGVIADQSELDAIVGNVETRVASVLGAEYDSAPAEITLAPVDLDSAASQETVNARAVEEALFEDTGAMIDAYGISVDGVELGYAATQADLQGLLDQLAQPYLTENTVDYTFVEDVQIFPVQVPSNTQFDLNALYEMLSSNEYEQEIYEVKRGDTYAKIAQLLDMTTEELEELNPDVNSSKLYLGQELVVRAAQPFLSVEIITHETYQETVESPVEYVDTANLYEGDTKTKTRGTDGLEQVEAEVTYLNGQEVARTELSRTTLTEATTTYVYRGTAERPATASTGSFIWPLRGTITSRFGYRNIFGSTSFHSGLDIAAPCGTTIVAADGGTVTHAGWRGTYGYTVIITHDDGTVTYYAHCSALLVSAGDKVYQGQPIAQVGMSGTATGYHCHFEVRVGGRQVNPENYL